MTSSPDPDQRKLIRRGVALVGGIARAHPVTFAVSVAGSVVFAVCTVLSTVLLGWLTDDLVLPAFTDAEPGRTRGWVLGAVVAVALLRSAGVVSRRYFAGMTVFRARNDLQRALGRQYLEMPADQLRAASKGRLLAHVDSDTDVATDAMSPLPFTLGVFTLLLVSVVSLALVDWVLMAVALALMPMIAGINRLQASKTEAPAIEVREGVARVSSIASESFDGAVVVKTLGREEAELAKFSVAAAQLRDDSVRFGRLRAIFAAVLDLVPDAGVVALVVLGAWRVDGGHITTGQLVGAVALFGVLVFPLRVIGYFFGDLPPAVVAHDRVTTMLARPRVRREGRASVPDGPIALEVRDVTVRYGDVPAVDAASLSVAPGEVVALVGPTGCGKSSLLGAIVDLVPVDSGEIRLSDVLLADAAIEMLTGRVAVAWQSPFLLDGSVSENIAFGGRYTEQDLHAAAEIAAFHEVATELPDGYDTHVGEQGVRLSGGQRQRLALARAVVRRPGLLLLDDATSALDPVVEERILAALRRPETPTTMLIVAHRRSTILLADRVVMMAGGRVTASGTHDELLAEPAYVALLEAYDREQQAALR